jgi:hypothetical protein
MIKKIILIIVLVFVTSIINYKSSFLQAQVVYVPLENGVYEFLERQNLKGIIELNDEVKPFSRMYIAEKLVLIYEQENGQTDGNNLNKVEEDELKFYLEEYYYEINTILLKKSGEAIKDIKERWFLYSYSDSLFNLKLSPIAGYGLSATGNLTGHTRWIGFSTFTTYSDWFGGSFDIRDKGEFGENVDREKSFTSERGAWYKDAPDGIEYSDVKGSINFNWEWGSVSLIKDYQKWGHGNFGQLIISDKAPSYPQIRLQLNPVSWLRFYYMHGWLNSLVLDSSSFYYSYPGTESERVSESYINKYIAANMLTVSPWRWMDISLGNAIVYSGDLRPEFFIPFMFYKFLDHNSGRGDVNDGNGMMYFDLAVKYPDNFKFYSTAFIDVTEIRNVLDGDYDNTWIGLTFGLKTIDLLISNLDFSLEYTRINPWVYEHKDETTTYKHIDYTMGHWLGQNADQIRLQLDYQLIRGLKFRLFAERLRKGGMDEIYYAYEGSGEKEFEFLYSPVRTEKRIGLDVSYQYIHDLVIKASYAYSDITDEEDREPLFLIGTKNNLSITLFYGLNFYTSFEGLLR